jgi:leader peptidase (prepilin peptidase)/N-methyltransferase
MTIAIAAAMGVVAGWLLSAVADRHVRDDADGRPRVAVEPFLLAAVTGALCALMAWELDGTWTVVAFCVWAAGLVVQSAIDLHTQRLPRRITYAVAAVGAPLLVIAALVADEPERIWMAALGAAIAFAFLLLVYVVSRGGMGDGDVRLAPLLGLYLGWLNPGIVPVGLFLGFLLGAVVGVGLMAAGSAGRKTKIPFGPFLAAGALLAVFVGQSFVDAVWKQ